MGTSANITYSCGGCDAETTIGPVLMQAHSESAFGGTLLRVVKKPKLDAEEHAPEGWVVFDPYTYCTYCPGCWADIMEDGEAGDRPAEPGVEPTQGGR